jgi:aspartyl protease family protein
MTRIAPAALATLLFLALPCPSAALTSGELNAAGMAAYTRGDFATAERLFGEAVSAAPQEPLYHYHRGVALVRLGRLAEARASYERALASNPPRALADTIVAALREFGAQVSRRAPLPEGITVPLENAHGVWFAEVMLNGTRRARFVVDTGATSCAISPDLAQELGIELAEDAPVVEIMTANGKTTGRPVSLDSIGVGEAEATHVATVVHTFEDGMEGILGNSFLGRYAVTLDAQRRLLHLNPRQ